MGEGSFLLRLWRATLYLALTVSAGPIQAVLLLIKSPLARRFPAAYHRLCCRVLGFRIERFGTLSTTRPTLFVANHQSYLDIPILGSIIEGSFVAKAEIADWPYFGALAKLQRSIFIDRRPGSTAKQRDAIMRRLEEGDDLIIFPEATSSDGLHVLPFKSALLSVAEFHPRGAPLVVQPVTVAYTRLDGMPLGRFYRPFVSWYGGMQVSSHLWTMLGLGKLTVRIIFHPTVTIAEFGSRKALAEHCYRVIASSLALTLAGRGPGDEAAFARAADAVLADWGDAAEADIAEVE
ncbi:MAG TPA: lysophospholipid acyltransferase family protein [Stellaceae bacterium]|nr:lysophospholipid acyltransferase family protein [Stellaceae bacterium]